MQSNSVFKFTNTSTYPVLTEISVELSTDYLKDVLNSLALFLQASGFSYVKSLWYSEEENDE